MQEKRLGDILDDYCSRCQLLTNHSVVALVGTEVKRVRCRTCNHEHNYRHGKLGRKKTQRSSAFEELLATLQPPPATVPPAPEKRPVRRKPPS